MPEKKRTGRIKINKKQIKSFNIFFKKLFEMKIQFFKKIEKRRKNNIRIFLY